MESHCERAAASQLAVNMSKCQADLCISLMLTGIHLSPQSCDLSSTSPSKMCGSTFTKPTGKINEQFIFLISILFVTPQCVELIVFHTLFVKIIRCKRKFPAVFLFVCLFCCKKRIICHQGLHIFVYHVLIPRLPRSLPQLTLPR